MAIPYPWFDVAEADESLLQGDFVDSCPIVLPPRTIVENTTVRAEVALYDVIIMSQSCDLTQKKLDLVLVCPIWPLSKISEEDRSGFLKGSKGKEALRRGDMAGYHLLNSCQIDGFEKEFLVVDFRSVYSVPFNFLIEFVASRGRRLRLLPPYREHLSQAFARFFMRVGLPADIPAFK